MTEKIHHKIALKALAIFLLGLFFFQAAQAQEGTKIAIRQADKHTYKKIAANDVAWLVGNVIYEHEGAVMHCDSSAFMRTENKFSAFGNVHINQGDTLHLYGDQMEYDGLTRMVFLSGNVRLNDGKMRLECNEIVYDRNLGSAYYTTGGVLNQQNNRLTSRVGAYNTNSKRFTFRDNVRLVNPKYNTATDTLQYGSESEIAYFYGPTTITADGTIIYCEHGNFDTRREIANLTQHENLAGLPVWH